MNQTTLNTIKETLWKYLNSQTTKAFIFDSRATKTHSKFSDIDIGLKSSTNIPIDVKINIQNDFENSNLPYIVEIVNFSQVDKKFKQVALKNTIPLN